MGKTFKLVGNDLSDGYHTFDELYEHRNLLFINLCQVFRENAVIGETKDGWFVLFLNLEKGQISYHLPERLLPLVTHHISADLTHPFDGHTSKDVVDRLTQWASD